MNVTQKAAGISAIVEAVIYIVAFVYFGAFWAYPSDGDAAAKMAYLAEHQLAVSAVYFLMYVVFGIFLTVLVVGLYETLKQTKAPIVKVGAVFGVVWVVLVIASGMLANIGLSHAISMMVVSTGKAYDLWVLISVIVEGLGGGNEIVGGLWVLLMSLAGLKAKVFSRGLNYIGLVVGVFGIATIYPAEVFTEIFGVSQVIWFVWLGTSLLRQSNATNAVQPVANGGRIKSL